MANKRKATAAPSATHAKRPAASNKPSLASSASKAKPVVGKKTRFEGPAPSAKALAAVKTAHKPAPAKAKAPRTVPTPAAPSTFVVSVGSYERLLYGLSCTFLPAPGTASDALPLLQVEPIFSFPAHLSSIKSVASSVLASPGTGSERKVGGKYLVSGGTDEVIKVWDLKRKKEVGSLEGEANGPSLDPSSVSQG